MSREFTCSFRCVGTPEYELKVILIALREVNKIPISEMAKRIGMSTERLRSYERTAFLSDYYNEHYIEALDEYVSLAAKQKVSFREALKIYMNQRCLHKLNITAKMTMLGKIMYESLEVNMTPKEEKELPKEMTTSKDAPRDRIWSEEKYDVAFFLLAALRKMLNVAESDVAPKMGITITMLKEFEKGVRNYEATKELRTLVIAYSKVLTTYLEEKGLKKDVYQIVSALIECGYTLQTDDLRLKKILLDELYKE